MSADIQQNTLFLAVSYLTFSNELHYLLVTRQKFTTFLHDIATSSPLLACTFRQWYCNSFSNDSANNASGISRRSWHVPKTNWLQWQQPSTNWKTWYRYIICTQIAFIWWKDCKNRSSISGDIWLNMPVFCHVVKKYTNEPFFLWSYWTKVHEIFTRYRGITCTVNTPIEVAISHSILDWQSDECSGVGNFTPFLPLNWLPWRRPLRYRKKVERCDHLQFNTYHMVQRLWKSVQRILRYFGFKRTTLVPNKIGCHGNVSWDIEKKFQICHLHPKRFHTV